MSQENCVDASKIEIDAAHKYRQLAVHYHPVRKHDWSCGVLHAEYVCRTIRFPVSYFSTQHSSHTREDNIPASVVDHGLFEHWLAQYIALPKLCIGGNHPHLYGRHSVLTSTTVRLSVEAPAKPTKF